jgi:hypothetical protein
MTNMKIHSHKELNVWQTAMDLAHYLTDDLTADFDQQYERLLAQLVTMARNPDKWTL